MERHVSACQTNNYNQAQNKTDSVEVRGGSKFIIGETSKAPEGSVPSSEVTEVQNDKLCSSK